MTTETRSGLPRRAVGSVVLCLVAAVLTACAPTGSQSQLVTPTAEPVYPELVTFPDITVVEDVPYGFAGAEVLLLDVCLPAAATGASSPRPAIVLIHGGSWMRGDKANLNWRSVCQWFASEGFVAASVNYRLAPAFVFPAQLEDVQQAVRWLRDPVQVERYQIDPARMGAFGGSAGGNLAALLGTAGSGPWNADARVAAVAEFSGPANLVDGIPILGSPGPDFSVVQLAYLGCADFVDCAQAVAASPVSHIDESDPPFFVGHSLEELIPLSQSEQFVEALRAAGLDATFVTVEGALHSIGMLDDDMKARLIDFFRTKLRAEPTVVRAEAE